MPSEPKLRVDPRRLGVALGVVAALGSLASAMAACAALAAVLPFAASTRVALALHTLVPLWVAGGCVTVTAANARRALALHGAVIAVCLAVVAGAGALRARSPGPPRSRPSPVETLRSPFFHEETGHERSIRLEVHPPPARGAGARVARGVQRRWW
ncbi:MAG: hypothetical protein IPK07_12020 [Deltaproteobacteria bacterium]|nr:hypothetical protein [Deltaproteobacteria bacterium]